MKYRIRPFDYQKGVLWNDMEQARMHSKAAKFRVMFLYDQEELLALAANLAYVQGRTAIDTDSTARTAVTQWFELKENENAPIIQNALDTALSKVENRLSALTPGRLERDRSYDVHTAPKKELCTEFVVGAGTKDSVLLNLQIQLKNFLIESVLVEWAGLTRPDALEYWTERAENHLEEAMSSARQCIPLVRIPKFPNW